MCSFPIFAWRGNCRKRAPAQGQLALERASTSRSAVQTMGRLAETYGYNDAAESLLVMDKAEAFVFQITRDDTGNSSIWVAQARAVHPFLCNGE